jgi:hypothetical protein
MALITCKECEQKYSSFADFCPHCGCPIISKEQDVFSIQFQKLKKSIAFHVPLIYPILIGLLIFLDRYIYIHTFNLNQSDFFNYIIGSLSVQEFLIIFILIPVAILSLFILLLNVQIKTFRKIDIVGTLAKKKSIKDITIFNIISVILGIGLIDYLGYLAVSRIAIHNSIILLISGWIGFYLLISASTLFASLFISIYLYRLLLFVSNYLLKFNIRQNKTKTILILTTSLIIALIIGLMIDLMIGPILLSKTYLPLFILLFIYLILKSVSLRLINQNKFILILMISLILSKAYLFGYAPSILHQFFSINYGVFLLSILFFFLDNFIIIENKKRTQISKIDEFIDKAFDEITKFLPFLTTIFIMLGGPLIWFFIHGFAVTLNAPYTDNRWTESKINNDISNINLSLLFNTAKIELDYPADTNRTNIGLYTTSVAFSNDMNQTKTKYLIPNLLIQKLNIYTGKKSYKNDRIDFNAIQHYIPYRNKKLIFLYSNDINDTGVLVLLTKDSDHKVLDVGYIKLNSEIKNKK